MQLLLVVALAALSARSALGHFIMTAPLTRAFSDDDEVTGPCGSFDAPVNPIAWPLTANASISVFHASGDITINVGIPPTAAADNYTTTDAWTWTPVGTKTFKEDGGVIVAGHLPYNESVALTWPDAISTLAAQPSGARAVIQAVVKTSDGVLYECADVVLGDVKGLPARTDNGTATIIDLRPGAQSGGMNANQTMSMASSASLSASMPATTGSASSAPGSTSAPVSKTGSGASSISAGPVAFVAAAVAALFL